MSSTRKYIDPWRLDIVTLEEMRIAQLVAEGMTNREIAEELGIAFGTVKEWMVVIFDKTGMANRMELALWFVSREAVSEEGLMGLA